MKHYLLLKLVFLKSESSVDTISYGIDLKGYINFSLPKLPCFLVLPKLSTCELIMFFIFHFIIFFIRIFNKY